MDFFKLDLCLDKLDEYFNDLNKAKEKNLKGKRKRITHLNKKIKGKTQINQPLLLNLKKIQITS